VVCIKFQNMSLRDDSLIKLHSRYINERNTLVVYIAFRWDRFLRSKIASSSSL